MALTDIRVRKPDQSDAAAIARIGGEAPSHIGKCDHRVIWRLEICSPRHMSCAERWHNKQSKNWWAMKDGVPEDGPGGDEHRDHARLQELYERLTVLVLRRRKIDEETNAVWNEIRDLEERL